MNPRSRRIGWSSSPTRADWTRRTAPRWTPTPPPEAGCCLTGKIPERLTCLDGASFQHTRPAEKGSYIRIDDGDRRWLGRDDLAKLDLVFLQGPFHVYELDENVEGLLRLIPADMFGPPEKCYYRKVSEHPALLAKMHGEGAVACFPWDIGSHYEQQCHQGHASLVLGTIDSLLGLDRRLHVAASPSVEVTHRIGTDGKFEWVALFNHSGRRARRARPHPSATSAST